jgi:hypothetical protein
LGLIGAFVAVQIEASGPLRKGANQVNDDTAGWPIPVWARRRGIGKTTAYKIIGEGRGPALIWPTQKRPIVTVEADRAWLDRMQREAQERAPRSVTP